MSKLKQYFKNFKQNLFRLSRRSQPPLFLQMVSDYFDAYRARGASFSKQLAYLKEFLPAAEAELNWWQAKRSTIVRKNNKSFRLFQYRVKN